MKARTPLSVAATSVAALFLSGCMTTTGDLVVQKMADSVNVYCVSNQFTRAAVRTNVAPYLAEGVEVKVTCPGDMPE